jgi:ferritin-like metal-binding protein YciE
VPTVAEVRGWRGRELIDPTGARIGVIAAMFRDRDTGSPLWLGVGTEEHPDDLTLVPVAGASATGQAVSVPHAAEHVRAAPRVPAAREMRLGADEEQALAAHYGLLYDTEHSATGTVVEPRLVQHRRPQPPERPRDPALQARVRHALRELQAIEDALVVALDRLSLRMPDDEVAHDLRLHRGETEDHAAALDARRSELGARRPLGPRFAAKARAATHDPALAMRDLYAIEHMQIARYTELERLAVEAGDAVTAQLARRHRADEEAMAATIAAGWTRLAELAEHDPGRLEAADGRVERFARSREDVAVLGEHRAAAGRELAERVALREQLAHRE